MAPGSHFLEENRAKGIQLLFLLARKLQEKHSQAVAVIIEDLNALGSREIEQTLEEMDGALKKDEDRILFFGITNDPDALDKALIRPGLFHEIVEIRLPDAKSIEGILRHYCKNFTLAPDVNFERIATDLCAQHYTPAEIKNLCHSAARMAGNLQLESITADVFNISIKEKAAAKLRHHRTAV